MLGGEWLQRRERQKSNKNETGKVIRRDGNKVKSTNEGKTARKIHFEMGKNNYVTGRRAYIKKYVKGEFSNKKV